MLQLVSSAFQSFVDLFVVTQPTLNVELLQDTANEAGETYRLTEPSGEYRDVFVHRRWGRDETDGKKVAITDFTSRATGYKHIHYIDHENLTLRGLPTVSAEYIDKPLSFEDHEVLVAYFEKQHKEHPSDRFKCQIIRLYSPVPTDGTGVSSTHKPSELKL